MSYILIFGVIVLIALIGVAAYFILGKKDKGIDGKYSNNLEELYVIVSQGKVLIMQKAAKQGGGFMMVPSSEFQIEKAQDPITIDNKQTDVYRSSNFVFGKYIFLAKNPTTGSLSFYKIGTSSYERLPEFPEDLRKVE